jgi:hypothetical protein
MVIFAPVSDGCTGRLGSLVRLLFRLLRFLSMSADRQTAAHYRSRDGGYERFEFHVDPTHEAMRVSSASVAAKGQVEL